MADNTPDHVRGIPVPSALRGRGGSAEYAFWKLAVTDVLDTVVPLLEEFEDDDPCDLDHHGYCQTHSLSGPPCRNQVLKDFLTQARERECVWQFGTLEWCFRHRPEGLQTSLVLLEDALKDRTSSHCVQCGRRLIRA